MVMRLFLIGGAAIIVAAWLLTVPFSPSPFQGSAPTPVETYREQGFIPARGGLVMSNSIGHEVFEVPSEDKEHAQMGSMAGMDMSSSGDHAGMPGMNMPKKSAEDHAQIQGMKMQEKSAEDHGQMQGMKMQEKSAEDHGQMQGMNMPEKSAEDHGQMPGMKMQEKSTEVHAQMQGMDMPEKAAEAQGQMQGMKMPAQGAGDHAQMQGMDMPEKAAETQGQMQGMGERGSETGGHGDAPAMTTEAGGEHGAGGAGLRVLGSNEPAAATARNVLIDMHEWGFTPGELEVKPGDVIRLTVRNTGNVPHEFMFMSHAAMGAVHYRQQRADWNLLEHEAAYEKSIVMPGDEFEVTVEIEQPGAWMFMCMFPYHMQFGMMGMMATPGMEMDMNMGGMQM